MQEDYPQEKLQEIYEVLPEDLKNALFSQEVTEIIGDICAEENLEEKQTDKISKYIGYVLLGLLSPNDFEKAIKERLFLPDDSAHKITTRIIRAVFIPLKTTLELIYKAQMNLPPEMNKEKLPVAEESSKEEKPFIKRQKKDVYRETAE